jgi:hypothetical protein
MTQQPTMTAKRYLEILTELGWTERGASHFFGVGERTMRRWKAEDHIARPVAMVLELMLTKQLTPETVLQIAKVRPKQIEFIMANLYDQRTVA